ncbi:GDSL-type esterase/lipase family protein [Actinomadura madurae]|uniref:GDSL-type esterase/lipase family protein n=1 Tax=Actinomadura madurae TaxID=1993 RepID=UPI0020D23407|nr:GDSL-type esterase/lipase family protein [Actinomadura madurae]MCP9967144.1 GDSL-type esterase/lipase family protein [Actinomadura madurae]
MVVLGDSVAEGQDDPHPAGGWLGWAGRLALHLGIPRDEMLNVSDPGAKIDDVARDQLPLVRDLRPRLVVLGCGMNDALRGFEPADAARRAGRAVRLGPRPRRGDAGDPGAASPAAGHIPDLAVPQETDRAAHS